MFKVLSKLYFLQYLIGKIVASVIPPFLVHNMGKYFAIKKAFYLTALEGLQGDYLEFGVFTGSSMTCALQCARSTRIPDAHMDVRFIGFDSFEGFGELSEKDKHPFYKNLNFETNFERVDRRLKRVASANQSVKLVKGFFNKTCDGVEPSKYGIRKAVVVLIDCDIYAGAESSFNFVEKVLQPGTIFILDDFFSYKGCEKDGICGAFNDWLNRYGKCKVRKISDYGMGGSIFIVSELG